ncbi:MAG: BsuPI-related putative proteinase inhibitor [Candidatus Sumerlaeia bacterium]|nr:BsuPI-related putative proteinase inhibitor [Candidatus Sumerlaeia bacterium]
MKLRTAAILIGCAAALFSAGCASNDSAMQDAGEITQRVLDPGQWPKTISQERLGMRLTVQLADTRVAPGGAISANVSLMNSSAEPQHLMWPTSQRFEMVVSKDPEGREPVAYWSKGMMFQQMQSEVTLAPGQSVDAKLDIPVWAAADSFAVDMPGAYLEPGFYFVIASQPGSTNLRTPALGVAVELPVAQ